MRKIIFLLFVVFFLLVPRGILFSQEEQPSFPVLIGSYHLSLSPQNPKAGEPITVIVDPLAYETYEASALYSTDNGRTWQDMPLAEDGGRWSGSLPPQYAGTKVVLTLRVLNENGGEMGYPSEYEDMDFPLVNWNLVDKEMFHVILSEDKGNGNSASHLRINKGLFAFDEDNFYFGLTAAGDIASGFDDPYYYAVRLYEAITDKSGEDVIRKEPYSVYFCPACSRYFNEFENAPTIGFVEHRKDLYKWQYAEEIEAKAKGNTLYFQVPKFLLHQIKTAFCVQLITARFNFYKKPTDKKTNFNVFISDEALFGFIHTDVLSFAVAE